MENGTIQILEINLKLPTRHEYFFPKNYYKSKVGNLLPQLAFKKLHFTIVQWQTIMEPNSRKTRPVLNVGQ
jgi:hypothetical protein